MWMCFGRVVIVGHTANNNCGKSAKTMDLKICIELGILRDKTINDKLIYIISKKEKKTYDL